MKSNSGKKKIGEKIVKDYLEQKKIIITDKKKNGSDIVIKKSLRAKKEYTIEIKTTENLSGGIPDMHNTEFKETKTGLQLVADYLYIVRLIDNNKCQIDILTKKDVDKYAAGSKGHKTKTSVRVSSTLKTDLKKQKIGKSIELKTTSHGNLA